MKKLSTISILITALISFTMASAQTAKPAIDYLQVKGPLLFQNKTYSLVWSAHPMANFYKQEYLAEGETPAAFKTMILVDVLTGTAKLKDVVAAKIKELKNLKATTPIVQYELLDNAKTGEYMIDFLLSANGPDGKTISIAEHNVYRYKTFMDKQGKTGVLLFGISKRSYGANIPEFLSGLKTKKNELVTQVSQYSLPQITIPK